MSDVILNQYYSKNNHTIIISVYKYEQNLRMLFSKLSMLSIPFCFYYAYIYIRILPNMNNVC